MLAVWVSEDVWAAAEHSINASDAGGAQQHVAAVNMGLHKLRGVQVRIGSYRKCCPAPLPTVPRHSVELYLHEVPGSKHTAACMQMCALLVRWPFCLVDGQGLRTFCGFG